MRYLSVCSGLEAATTAWHTLGWEPAAFAEIEKFPSAVLNHHYPEVPNLGDMTKYKEWNIGHIDVLVGGTPCQSFSVAGLRKGLEDPRGNLALVYLGIAKRFQPRWFAWENVPGVLSSSKGEDFRSFLSGLAGWDIPMPKKWGNSGIITNAPGSYGVAWRVLDAQYFGVPQRRRRVFVVGYLGDWRRAAAVLFERESVSGNPAPSRGKGKEAAGDVAACLRSGGDGGVPSSRGEHLVVNHCADVAPTLGVKSWAPMVCPSGQMVDWCVTSEVVGAFGQNRCSGPVDVSHALQAHPGPQGRINFESETFLVMAHGQANAEISTERSPALTCNHEAPIAFYPTNRQPEFGNYQDVSPAVKVGSSGASGRNTPMVQNQMQVRRLTPTECERLQGFPDGYTNILPKTPDGPRYKALGNSMAVPVMRWIGKRIQEIDQI